MSRLRDELWPFGVHPRYSCAAWARVGSGEECLIRTNRYVEAYTGCEIHIPGYCSHIFVDSVLGNPWVRGLAAAWIGSSCSAPVVLIPTGIPGIREIRTRTKIVAHSDEAKPRRRDTCKFLLRNKKIWDTKWWDKDSISSEIHFLISSSYWFSLNFSRECSWIFNLLCTWNSSHEDIPFYKIKIKPNIVS